METHVRDFEVAVQEAESSGLALSEDMKSIMAIMSSELSNGQRAYVLGLLQAEAQNKGEEQACYASTLGYLRSLGDAYTLGPGAKPRAQLTVNGVSFDEDDEIYVNGVLVTKKRESTAQKMPAIYQLKG